MKLAITPHISPLRQAFAISRGAKTQAKTIIVTLQHGGFIGRGECVPYPRYNESLASVTEEIEAVRGAIEAGVARLTVVAVSTGLGALRPAICQTGLPCVFAAKSHKAQSTAQRAAPAGSKDCNAA